MILNVLNPQGMGKYPLSIMDNLLIWNVRGLNHPSKQREVRNYINANNIGLCALLETKVKAEKFREVHQSLFRSWCISTNFCTVKGGRILIAWLPDFFQVVVVKTHPQFIHAEVRSMTMNCSFQFTAVYGMNDDSERGKLWEEIKKIGV